MTSMSQPHHRIAFLLSQLGADAASGFEQALQSLHITPSDAGLLRLIGRTPGVSQRVLSQQIGVGPSRIVAVLDRLERRELIERRRSRSDRRSHEVSLTANGQEVLAEIRPLAEAHEQAYTDCLSLDEADLLRSLLGRIADSRGLSSEIHRGTAVG
ncbi:MarR family winged helix-turn-helix transcriptional regulator [Brevibacterium marinum]|uniref:DNA-binding MarR family transcriptional regulator n=1 Tax=Brevibacterium marinum TaxID=418643 RepID=A0A846S3K4_9MICO|nr:MarR family winged helix-turn-helix transcriptional regulator [Brevibacterium marinum]NJC58726.1 DNA-binding MarR family transcriptional regulator [Brevibacterium marinum]